MARNPWGEHLPRSSEPHSRCPSWCVSAHGSQYGEEDWVHTSEPMTLTDRLLVRVCMTVDPSGTTRDGPYVLIGSAEFTPDEANDVGLAIQALATVARATNRPGAL